MTQLFWEDFTVGTVAEYGPRLVTREEIIAYAAQYDPQPFHLDEAAGTASMLGGLAASGWHACALSMRILYDGFIGRSASMGSPGVEELRWLRPVRPNDQLVMRTTVLETRPSRSRPEMGFVKFQCDMLNAARDTVMTFTCVNMMGRRASERPVTAGA